MRCKGFLLGGTAGRTTLNGEGLQHQDGQSHLLLYPLTDVVTYDPAYAYELAVIIRDGIRRMYEEQESVFYYLTVMNENYKMPAMPEGVKEGIIRGMYKLKSSELKNSKCRAQLFGSGTILNEVVKAQEILEDYKVSADVWSVTSYKELRRDALDIERWNLLHPSEEPKVPYITKILKDEEGVFVASSDYVKALPDSISKWVPRPLISLGTDGFGRSESRMALRDFFEVDAKHIVLAALYALLKDGKIKSAVVEKAMKDLGINPDKRNPMNT
jgi:pyruvate dehydrogenase E1 component